jgi:hypothetical protein
MSGSPQVGVVSRTAPIQSDAPTVEVPDAAPNREARDNIRPHRDRADPPSQDRVGPSSPPHIVWRMHVELLREKCRSADERAST